jgi:hypothetical protein
MEHLNRRGQNVFSSFAQTVLHIHEALEIARVKDEDGHIGECSGYIVMCRDRQGFEQIPHNCDRLRDWATLYKSRESTTSLKQGFAVKQAECLLTSLAPGLRFDKRVKSNTPKRSTPRQSATMRRADRALRDGPPKLTPPAELAGTPISDDETVAKMGHTDFDVRHPTTEI